MKRNIFTEVIAFLLVLLLLYAAFSKLWHFANFRLQLSESPWHLLAITSDFVAWALPLGEIALSILLLWAPLRRIGFVLSAVLFGIFIAYLAILLHSGQKLPCLCGGIISELSWQGHAYLNAGFLIVSLTGVYLERNTRKRKRHDSINKRFIYNQPI